MVKRFFTKKGALKKEAAAKPTAVATPSEEAPAKPKAVSLPNVEARSTHPTADVRAPGAPAAPPAAEKPVATVSRTASAAGMLGELAASLRDDGGFHFSPSQAAIDAQPKGHKAGSIALGDASDGGSVLKMAGGDLSAPSSGSTGGFTIRVPDAFERQASERTVRVRVLARSAEAAPTRLAIAYSTNEVGNSGWNWRDVGADWGIYELVWKVPKMVTGRGDFIGLLPAVPGAPGVEIHSMSAKVV